MTGKAYAALLALVLAAASSVLLGNVEFAGYDASVLIDSSWRWHSGQHPYTDYPCMLPPLFYMLGGAAFTLFGVHWFALTIMASLLFLLLALAGLAALRSARADTLISLAYVSALFIPQIITNHLWHSTMANAFATTALLLAYVLFDEYETRSVLRRSWLAQLALVFAALLLSKPNIALVAIAGIVTASALRRRLCVVMLGALLAGAVIAWALLALNGIHPMDVLNGYLETSERPADLAFLGFPIEDSPLGAETTMATYALMVGLFFACALYEKSMPWRLMQPARLVGIAGIVTSLAGFSTNWDIKLNDIGPALLGVTLLLCHGRQAVPKARTALICCLLAACLTGLVAGYGRIRMELAGQWAGEHYGRLTLLSDPFFGTIAAREKFASILDTTDRVMKQTPKDKVYFGPRMEFMYARAGIASPKHVPIWWHPGTSYAIGDQEHIIDAWEAGDFTVLIFAKDFTRMPLNLLHYIWANYQRYEAEGSLIVYIKRGREGEVFGE